MRRATIVFAIAASMLAWAIPAGSAPIKPRTIEFPYTGAGEIKLLDLVQIQTSCIDVNSMGNYGGACFLTGDRDRFMEVEVTDDTGLPIGFTVYQGKNHAEFCETTGKPLPVKPHAGTQVVLGVTGCATPSVPVQGVIRVTFSR